MAEVKPSHEYRSRLAKELIHARSAGRREEASGRLKDEKGTHRYQLARVLKHLVEESGTKFDQRRLDEETVSEGGFYFSNEINLREVFESTKELEGVGIGVGVDQMFDLYLHSKLDEVYLIDITPRISLTSRVLLEIGRRHHALFGNYPDPDTFLHYIEPDQIEMTFEMIGNELTDKEREFMRNQFLRRSGGSETQSNEAAPRMVHHILSWKRSQPDTWISNAENLAKIIEGYELGKIHVVQADIAGKSTLPRLAQHLSDSRTEVSCLYLSNLRGYLGFDNPALISGEYTTFMNNIGNLPIDGSSIIITSDLGPITSLKPSEIERDQYLDHDLMMWSYSIQTVDDFLDSH